VSGSLVDVVVDRVRTMPGETIVVVDPDGMVRSLPVLDALRATGVDAVWWEEPLESRLAWEEPAPAGGRLVVVEQPYRADVLPADVLEVTSRRVTISADHLFGPLDRSVVVQLDWADREAAFVVAAQLPTKALTATETASQLLRRRYRFDPDVMTQPVPLLEGLLRHHRTVRGAPISRSLAEMFAVAVGDPLPGLRTVDAVVDRGAFVAWLQASWDIAATEADDGAMRALLLADGPAQLLDDYFDDGVLRPVEIEASVGKLPFGVSNDPGIETRRRVVSGIAAIGGALDSGELSYDGWRAIAERWADVLAAQYSDVGAPGPDLATLRARLNEAFVGWLLGHYSELATLPSVTVPAMVHRASRVLEIESRDTKVALVLVDGLSIAVWRTILPIVRGNDWRVSEAATFAWLPTITSISRQAIFAGRPPSFFGNSIGTTSKEAMLWRAWWSESAKLPDHEIGYVNLHLRNLGEGGPHADTAFAGQLGRRVLGVVVEDVDHEIHGERLGEGVLHAGLRTWAKEGHLGRLLDILLGEGYRVTLTSDHGFIEAESVGVSQAGATADAHGRFEVFSDPLIAKQAMAKSKLEGRLPWTNFGLPPDYLVVFAPLFGVLKPKGDHLLTHGGPTLEEVIVPWVTITR
jgi:hypothetical protein